MDNSKEHEGEQRILSLCSGSLGIEKGISAITPNIRTVAYVEIEAFIIHNLACSMEKGFLDPAPIWTDLKTFDGEPFRGKIHGITGGYPCQPFSKAGRGKGTDDERHLWPHIREIVRTVNPIWCLFENVEEHLNVGYEDVYRDLRSLGYAVEAGIFSASEVGAPHQRKRLFILAVLEHSQSWWTGKLQNPIGKRQGYGASWASGIFNGKGFSLADSKDERCRRWQDLDNIQRRLIQKHEKKFESMVWSETKGRGGESKELAYPDSPRSLQNEQSSKLRSDRTKQPSGAERKAKPYKDAERRKSQKTNLDDSECQRLERYSGLRERNSERWEEQERPSTEGSAYCGFPARPTDQQRQWEEPRAIESGVGCSVDGNNFRTDLLRMYGNGVLEQTASKAWVMLWNKLAINQNK